MGRGLGNSPGRLQHCCSGDLPAVGSQSVVELTGSGLVLTWNPHPIPSFTIFGFLMFSVVHVAITSRVFADMAVTGLVIITDVPVFFLEGVGD